MDEKISDFDNIMSEAQCGRFTVYMHRNRINDKKYIGITKQNTKYRWRSDGSGYIHSPYFAKAIEKYGWDNFEHIILHSNVDETTAKKLEQYYIKYYNTRQNQNGYNMTAGGDGTFNIIVTQETRQKLSIAGKGIKRSQETKLKQSIARKGKKPTEETIKKLSASHLGKRLSPKAREIAKKVLREQTEKRKKKIYAIDDMGNKLNFNSISDASKQMGIKCLSKNFKRIAEYHHKCGGYYWNYGEN